MGPLSRCPSCTLPSFHPHEKTIGTVFKHSSLIRAVGGSDNPRGGGVILWPRVITNMSKVGGPRAPTACKFLTMSTEFDKNSSK